MSNLIIESGKSTKLDSMDFDFYLIGVEGRMMYFGIFAKERQREKERKKERIKAKISHSTIKNKKKLVNFFSIKVAQKILVK